MPLPPRDEFGRFVSAPPPLNWREANRIIGQLQDLATEQSNSHATPEIDLGPNKVALICLSDVHVGSMSTDHRILERVTNELLAIPDLYVALLGDMAQTAIRLRSVDEVLDNALSIPLQMQYLASWAQELREKIVLSTWDNHSVMRQEELSGHSVYGDIFANVTAYIDSIGHPDIKVGEQLYKVAVSHRFTGSRSLTNPCSGIVRYLTGDGHEREVGIAGDSHRPGLMTFWHGPTKKLAVNCGTAQTANRYSQRHFSLYSHAVFPVIEFHADRHLALAYDDVPAWLAATGRG